MHCGTKSHWGGPERGYIIGRRGYRNARIAGIKVRVQMKIGMFK